MGERNSHHNSYLKETLKLDTFCDFICWKSTAYSCKKNLLTSVTVTTSIVLGSVKHVFVGLFTYTYAIPVKYDGIFEESIITL